MKLSTVGLLAAALLSAVASPVMADPDFRITEIYVGLPGPDGTADWLEITNFGDMAGSLDGLFYDDVSADITEGGVLPDVTIAPGQSVVGLIDVAPEDAADEIADFRTLWGGFPTVFTIPGGGGLGQSGDTAVLLDGVGEVISSFSYNEALSSMTNSTIERINGFDGTKRLSVFGEEGAYASAVFENDSLFPGFTEISLIGSPGRIPEPASVALLLLAAAPLFGHRF